MLKADNKNNFLIIMVTYKVNSKISKFINSKEKTKPATDYIAYY